MNHAHNEWLQLWLELGWPGAILALFALVALGRAGYNVWRSEPGADSCPARVLARAATISLLVAVIHAYFDYSLRSGANLAVFAMLATLLLREGFPGSRRVQPAVLPGAYEGHGVHASSAPSTPPVA